MGCTHAKHAAKKSEQALEHEAIPMNILTRNYFNFSKLGTVEYKMDHIGVYQGFVFHLKDAPGSRTRH